ncbi:MAG: MFS transporter, partial [Chloroflexota bacterium]
MFTVLRQRNFALLWFGQLISLIGDWVLFIALPFYIYELTGSTLATGAMFIAQLLPGLLLGSVAGVCADRWDRKRMMIAADVLRALVLLLLLVVRSTEWLWLIYLVAFAQSAIGQFFMPARSALIPQIVGEQELLQANSLSAVSDSLTRLIGPSLGGLLFAWFGLASVVFVDAASFAVSALLIALVVVPARHIGVTAAAQSAATWARVWRDWRDGLRVIRRERLLVGLFVVMGLFSVADAIFTTLLVGFAKDIMRIGTQQLGVMMALQGVGGLLGGLVLTRVGQRLAPAR